MKRLIVFVFINVFLRENVMSTKLHDSCPATGTFSSFNCDEKLTETKNETHIVCKTQECQKIAKVILENMDKSVDPCDDFYEYTCGKWGEIPLQNRLQPRKLKEMIEFSTMRHFLDILNAGPKDDDIQPLKVTKALYKTCMDADAIEEQGLDPLVFILSRAGGWPLIMDPNEWNGQRYIWQTVDDYYARLTGDNTFHTLFTYENFFTKEGEKTISISLPELPPEWKKFLSESYLNKTNEERRVERPIDGEMLAMKAKLNYMDYVSNVARAIAKASDMKIFEEQFDKDIMNLILFQDNLATLAYAYRPEINKTYTTKTIKDFQKWYDSHSQSTSSNIDWLYKINTLLNDASVFDVNIDLEIQVYPLGYFDILATLLHFTPTRTIVNYIHWNFISKVLMWSTNEMRKLYNSWGDVKGYEADRWLSCAALVDDNVVLYDYMKQHVSDEIVETTLDMLIDINKEMVYQIKKSDWMDKVSKDFFLWRLIKMQEIIEYPDWYKNTTNVKGFFKELIVGKSHFENFLSYKRYRTWRNLRELRDNNNDIDMWWAESLEVNTCYRFISDIMVRLAGFLHSPLFDYNRPQAINFGFVGSIMARKLNDHIEYLLSKKYDPNALSPLVEAIDTYSRKAQCFEYQYYNHTIDQASGDEIGEYGNYVLSGNIADVMGLQTAFRTYRSRERKRGTVNSVLPGLEEFTNDQLFFLSYGNLMCDEGDPSEATKKNYYDNKRLRVIGSVSNSEDFSEAFNCPVGSAMNPKKKCNIWK